MYIMKRPSRGRGEYEIAEPFNSNPPISPSELQDHEIHLKFSSFGFKPTANVLLLRNGKLRLRLLDEAAYIHSHRQVQAALLFPKSTRDESALGGGRPTIRFEQYVVRQMHFKELRLTATEAFVELGALDLFNGSQTDSEDFESRMLEVERLHNDAEKFPPEIKRLLMEHQQIMRTAGPIPIRAERIVRELMDEVARIAADYNIDYVSSTDVLHPLQEMVNQPQIVEPLSIESIPPDEVEIRLREAAKWRRFVAVRGPEAAAFRRMVRDAYDSRCIVCGIRLPASSHCRVPGVDSAHILPWASHDMDNHIGNGLCLCRMHHWAFDEQLIAITHENGEYRVSVTERARAAFDAEALQFLKAHTGVIPRTRLPTNPEHWPRPQFLREFYEMCGG